VCARESVCSTDMRECERECACERHERMCVRERESKTERERK